MRRIPLLLLLLLGCVHSPEPIREPASLSSPAPVVPAQAPAPPGDPSLPSVDFDSRVRPLLQARCSPCHFPGGIMYARLPFDQADTVRCLGTRLFTRLQAKEDQALILQFVASPGSGK